MKKALSIIVILLFLLSVGALIFSIQAKNSSSSYFGNLTNPNGFWLSDKNTLVTGYKILERSGGYITGYDQQENSPYYIKFTIANETGGDIREVNIPRAINSDAIKLTYQEIAKKIGAGGAVIASIATDTKTKEEYLDYISFLKTE